MVKIFDQQQSVILALFALHVSGPVDIEHGKHDGAQKDDNQAGEAKIFDQPKRLGFFRNGFWVHIGVFTIFHIKFQL